MRSSRSETEQMSSLSAWPQCPVGQTRKSALITAMSAFPPIATKLRTSRHVGFVPEPEVKFSGNSSVWDAHQGHSSTASRPRFNRRNQAALLARWLGTRNALASNFATFIDGLSVTFRDAVDTVTVWVGIFRILCRQSAGTSRPKQH